MKEQILQDFLATLQLGAFISAIVFGLLVGFAYGWRATAAQRQADVSLLFAFVLGFFIMRAAYNVLTGSPIGAGRSLGGILLVVLSCLAILVGGIGRKRFEVWRRQRTIREIRSRFRRPPE